VLRTSFNASELFQGNFKEGSRSVHEKKGKEPMKDKKIRRGAVAWLLLLTSASAKRLFFGQVVDHFEASGEKEFWKQDFFVNNSQWSGEPDAPVFLCVGGEGPPLDDSVVTASVHCNDAVELLEEFQGLMFAIQHRFYGCQDTKGGCPNRNISSITAQDLQVQSSRQAIQDLATFHEYASKQFNISSEAKWILFGGSYPGMLAAFTRLKFPHLFHAAVSSSAPVQAQFEMREYNDIVSDAYTQSSVGGFPECRDRIKDGHAKIGEYLKTQDGRTKLEEMFKFSQGYLDSHDAQVEFTGSGVANFPAQSNDPNCEAPVCNIGKICQHMISIDEPLDALILLRQKQQDFKETASGMDLWLWQVCTEFGFLQTCEVGSQCMFTQGLLLTADLFRPCKAWGFDESFTKAAIERSNLDFGGHNLLSSRILWANGSVDPWKGLSVLKLSKEQEKLGQKILIVDGASHHAWTHPSSSSDQSSVVQARKFIEDTIRAWLSDDGNEVELEMRMKMK